MEDDSPSAAEKPATSAPLLTLRGICIITVLVGLILASSASKLRELNGDQLTLITVHIMVVLVAFGIFVIVYGARRRRLEQEAGPLLFGLDRDWNQLFSAWDHSGLLLFGVILVSMGVQQFNKDLEMLSGAFRFEHLHYLSTLPIFGCATFFLCIGLWDFDNLQLRKYGAILGLTFTPWAKLKTCRWSAFQENTLLIGWGKMHQFPVDPQDRPMLESILADISAQKNQPKSPQA